MRYLHIFQFYTLILFSLLLSGCHATTGYYLGALADDEAVTAINPVLDTQQRWEDLYVTVDSRLTRQAGRYQMSGKLSFSQHSRMMYVRVAHVELTLFLLDADNRVVEYRRANHYSGLRPDDRIPFTVTLPAVDQAVAYAFRYEIRLIDEEGNSSTNWFYPRIRH